MLHHTQGTPTPKDACYVERVVRVRGGVGLYITAPDEKGDAVPPQPRVAMAVASVTVKAVYPTVKLLRHVLHCSTVE